MDKQNKLQRAPTGSVTLPALPAERLIKAVYQFNQLRAFSLTDVEILEWARSIERLRPHLDIEHMEYSIDAMKQGNIEYDNTKGIQNIFNAIAQVCKNDDGTFRVLRAVF